MSEASPDQSSRGGKQPSLGQLVRGLADVRKQIEAINKQLKDLGEEKGDLEGRIMGVLREQGLQRVAIDGYTVTLSSQIVPKVVDWGGFSRYVLENDALYLLQRRLSAAPYRDILEKGEQVPGLEPFNAETLSFRSTG